MANKKKPKKKPFFRLQHSLLTSPYLFTFSTQLIFPPHTPQPTTPPKTHHLFYIANFTTNNNNNTNNNQKISPHPLPIFLPPPGKKGGGRDIRILVFGGGERIGRIGGEECEVEWEWN